MGHRLLIASTFCILSSLCVVRATAQDSELTPREQELERLVRELSARVAGLERRLDEREGTDGAPTETLEPRVESLERSIEQIQSAPPPPDAAELTEMRKAIELFSEPNTMRAYWKEGLRLDSIDGSFKLKIGGRIHYDLAYFGADHEIEHNVGSLDDGTEFRRARIFLSGDIYDNINFKVQYEFAGGDADFKDVYMAIKNVPVVGHVRIGHFKEPFSLEELTSSNYNTFMEPALPNTFSPSRNAGLMIHDTLLDQRMTWAAGFFRVTDDFGSGSVKRDYNATVRLTGLPWYEDDGRRLLHLGVGYTHKNFEDDTVRFRERPESHLAPRFADTGVFPAEYADIVGAELALVLGPFSLQGEYMQAFVESRVAADPKFWGTYLQASYFLTGEHRRYKRSTATFDRIRPKKDFGKNGWGAWELAARYSHLDLNSAHVDGGELRDFTFGLNWYLNPNMRIMWNYVRADLTGDSGDANIYQVRFQLNF